MSRDYHNLNIYVCFHSARSIRITQIFLEQVLPISTATDLGKFLARWKDYEVGISSRVPTTVLVNKTKCLPIY